MYSIHKLSIGLCAMALLVAAGCQSRSKQPFEDVARAEAERPPHEQIQTDAAVAVAQAPEPAAAEHARKAAEAAAKDHAMALAEPVPTTQMRRTRMVATMPTTYPVQLIRIDTDGGVIREWPLATAYRPSGDVLAGPTYYAQVEEFSSRPEWQTGFIELGAFLLDTALLPVRMVIAPPWTPVVYSAITGPDDPGETQSWVAGSKEAKARQMRAEQGEVELEPVNTAEPK